MSSAAPALLSGRTDAPPCHAPPAIEERVFSLKTPEAFFTLFGNPGGMVAAELAQDRFEEEVKLIGRSVRGAPAGSRHVLKCGLSAPPQLLNVLATLGENPYIRYYAPTHHPPLGPLALAATPGSLAPASAAPPSSAHPGDVPQRWRAALSSLPAALGQRAHEYSGDQVCKRLAVEVQRALDEYGAENPEFPVGVRWRRRRERRKGTG